MGLVVSRRWGKLGQGVAFSDAGGAGGGDGSGRGGQESAAEEVVVVTETGKRREEERKGLHNEGGDRECGEWITSLLRK